MISLKILLYPFEVNNSYVDQLIQAGLVVSSRTPSENLCEIIELSNDDHPWFFGCQFHPEFTSNPKVSHPLFLSFINAALSYQKGLTSPKKAIIITSNHISNAALFNKD